MLITMYMGEALHSWALALTTAYAVLAFVGSLGVAYASPNVDEPIRTSEPALGEDAPMKQATLIPFIPRRANVNCRGSAKRFPSATPRRSEGAPRYRRLYASTG